MNVTEAAEALHVTRQTLHRSILARKAAVTPAMALRLGKFCLPRPHGTGGAEGGGWQAQPWH